MPAISYGSGAYRRERGDLPEFTLVNMYLEATPSAEAAAVLLSRPGLTSYLLPGAGPIKAVFSQPGTYGGDIFTVSGGNFYRQTTLLAAIAGTGPVSIAASATEVLVTAGSTLYSYNGTDTVAVTLPDAFSALAVTHISGHFVVGRSGSHKYYWSALLNGRSWDALNFASAESEPDYLLDVETVRGNLYLMGQSSIEPWYYQGALNLPFSLIQQRIFPQGILATGSAVEMDNSLLWVGSDGLVYRTGDVAERISDHGIEERIAQSATVSAFSFVHEGHNFFCLRLATGTYAYDAATRQWCELRTYGRANFAGQCATVRGQIVLLGDDTLGKVWTFGGFTDGGVALHREWTGAFPLKGGALPVDNLTVDANAGQTDLLTGQGSDPLIELETSRNAGATWGEPRMARLGKQGEYRTRTRWNRLGLFDAPGAMFRFRITDPVDVRVSSVLINEAGGGRSRGA